MAATPREKLAFIERLWAEAPEVIASIDAPASAIIAMACLETGFGTSDHWKNNNILFGITAPYKDGWVLPGCQVKGTEWIYLPTQAIKDGPVIQDRFCIASDVVTAMVLFRSYLANHPMLKTANGKIRMAAARNDPEQFAKVMAQSCLFGAGNAVEYPRAVMSIINQENLRRFD
jgi:Mannosyl-glycoprotein endo-beta-N-acetylglucosaminidase